MQNPYSAISKLKIGKITDAKDSLFQGVIELWKLKTFNKINIKELMQASPIAKSTFFANYHDIDELIEEVENYYIIELMKRNKVIMDSEINVRGHLSYYKETIDYIEENKDFFYTFVVENINNRFINKWKDAIKYQLLERDITLSNKENCHLILEVVASELVAAYIYWIKHPYEVDINCLDKIVCETLKLIEF